MKDKDLIKQLVNALKANGVFHTPIQLRKNGHPWDEYQIDAINRTREALNLAANSGYDGYSDELNLNKTICKTCGKDTHGMPFHTCSI